MKPFTHSHRSMRCRVAILAAWATLAHADMADSQELALPRAFRLGESAEMLRPVLAEDCERTQEMHHTGQMAAPFEEQTQIDCFGLDVLGARRKVEFMFNDGPLGHAWIHLRSAEVQGLRAPLERSFGEVVHATEKYYVFASGTIALRFDPPEILVASPALIEALTGYQVDANGM